MNDSQPNSPMSVSVIVPAYGASPHLEAVLDGLSAQNDEPDEIFVSHSGSDDPTKRLAVSHPNVTVLHSSNRLFAGAARNRAIDIASSDILAFCDDDTVPATDWVAIVRRLLSDRQSILVGAVDVQRTGGYWGMSVWLCEFSEQAPWGGRREQRGGASCNMAVRCEDIRKVGGFPEDFRAGQDTMLLNTLRQSGLKQVFEPALRVGHFNIAGFGHFRRHLLNQGRHFAKARKAVPMSGHAAVRFWPLAPLLGVAKCGLIFKRILTARQVMTAIRYFPGVVLGTAIWTAGCTYAAATSRFTGRY